MLRPCAWRRSCACEVCAEKNVCVCTDHWDVKKSLDLWGVQVDANDSVCSSSFYEISNEFACDGCSWFVLLILTCVAKAGNHLLCTRTLEKRQFVDARKLVLGNRDNVVHEQKCCKRVAVVQLDVIQYTYSCDSLCGCSLCSVNHDEQFHEVVWREKYISRTSQSYSIEALKFERHHEYLPFGLGFVVVCTIKTSKSRTESNISIQSRLLNAYLTP